jgi:dynein heavy chain
MSSELDEMYSAFLDNRVPANWTEIAYPSLKPLSSWIKDLYLRVEFMRNWLVNGHPPTYWLSGFFFPHGFMTGILQTFARKHKKAIDLLSMSFEITKLTDHVEVERPPSDGIYVYGLFIEGAKWNLDTRIL